MSIDPAYAAGLVEDDGSNTVGTIWTKAKVVALIAAIDAELAGVACLLENSVTISWGTGVWADLPFSAENYDPLNLHGLDAWSVVVPTAGTYGITATVVWPPSAVGVRGIVIGVNGVWRTPNQFDLAFNGGVGIGVTSRVSSAQRLAAGDSVRVQLFHNAGGAEVIPIGGARLNVWRISK